MKILLIAGARPNFMKIAPILRAIERYNIKHSAIIIEPILVHTGQHYDHSMSDSFFKDLGIKTPDYHLGCSGESHAEQTAGIMIEFEKVCIDKKPDFVLVVGDVNSTIAAGLVTKKLHIKLIHVEAGLRSGDRNMPEEINRLATDAITDLFFTTEKNGTDNLLKEAHPVEKVYFVGHVMIDNLFYQLSQLNKNKITEDIVTIKKSLPKKYFCLTLHRPSNVDNKENLKNILTTVNKIACEAPIVIPCHPRTKKMIVEFNLESLINNSKLIVTPPLRYNDFLYLWKDCSAMLTDSGGIQEETTALQIPCLTIRENTERPVTVDEGTNTLIGLDMSLLEDKVKEILKDKYKKGKIPNLWDGNAAKRIVEALVKNYKEQNNI